MKEKDGCLPFLDANIFCGNEKFATNVHRKKSLNGVYTSKVSHMKYIKLV